jgi:hypothetical protein
MTPWHRLTLSCLVGWAWLAAPIGAVAAPFCRAGGYLPGECIYDDLAQCVRAAKEIPQANCFINPQDTSITLLGRQKFCVVTNSRVAECYYTDFTTCELDAERKHGACAWPLTDSLTDPYRTDRRKIDVPWPEE